MHGPDMQIYWFSYIYYLQIIVSWHSFPSWSCHSHNFNVIIIIIKTYLDHLCDSAVSLIINIFIIHSITPVTLSFLLWHRLSGLHSSSYQLCKTHISHYISHNKEQKTTATATKICGRYFRILLNVTILII